MTFEIYIVLLSLTSILLMAYLIRNSFEMLAIFSIAVFGVGLSLLKFLIGDSPTPTTNEAVLISYGGFTLFSLTLFILAIANHERGLAGLAEIIHRLNPSKKETRLSLLFIFVLWGFRIFEANVYGLGFEGTASADVIISLPYPVVVFSSIINLISGGAIIILTIAATQGGGRWLWLIIFVELLMRFSSGGRRALVFYIFVVLWIALQARVIRLHALIFYVVVLSIILYIISPLFLEIREANLYYLSRGFDTFSALSLSMFDAFQKCGIGIECLGLASNNIIERPNVVEFFKSVVDSHLLGSPFIYGEGFVNAIKWAIPSIILSKPEFQIEHLVQFSFGLKMLDDAISIPVIAYADGGLLGCMFAGICVVFFTKYFSMFANSHNNDLLVLSMLLGLANNLWNVENDPLYYFVLVRDSLIIRFIIYDAINFIKFSYNLR